MRAVVRLKWGKGPMRGEVEAAYVDCFFKTFGKRPREMRGFLREMCSRQAFFNLVLVLFWFLKWEKHISIPVDKIQWQEKVEDAGERGIEQRSIVFEKARVKRIDVNSREGGNRPMEGRGEIAQIFRWAKIV